MKSFRILLGLTAMLMLGGPSMGDSLENRTRTKPPDIATNENAVNTPNRPMPMNILPWTTGFFENRTTGSNDAIEDELVTRSTNDVKTATTDQGSEYNESLELLRLKGNQVETGEHSIDASAMDTDISTAENTMVETSELFVKTPSDSSTIGNTVEPSEPFAMTPVDPSATGGLVEASESIAGTSSDPSTTGIIAYVEKRIFGSADLSGTIGTTSQKAFPSEAPKKIKLRTAQTSSSVPGKAADYQARAILLFVMASLIIMPIKTTLYRLGNACHSSKPAFWIHVVFSVMVCTFMAAAVIIENFQILGTYKTSGTAITGIINSREGIFWCGLVALSTATGFAMPLTRAWNDWVTFVCGVSGDFAFTLSCHLACKHQLMDKAQDEAWKALKMLINHDGKIENLSLTTEDFIFMLVCYFFVNWLLEHARKRETKDSYYATRHRVIYDEETGYGGINEQSSSGNAPTAIIVSSGSASEAVPVPVPKPAESTVINMEDVVIGDN